MWFLRILTNLFLFPIKLISKTKQQISTSNYSPSSILILWPKTNLGLLLASRIVLARIKKKIPNIKITLVLRNPTIRKTNSKDLISLLGLNQKDEIITYNLFQIISKKFDIAMAPSITDFSILSHIVLGLSKSNIKIGVNSIDNNKNSFSFLFNYKSDLSWEKFPDIHISEFLTNQFPPFLDLSLQLGEQVLGEKFEGQVEHKNGKLNILLNNEPEEKSNRMSLESLLIFVKKLQENHDCFFYYIEDEMEPDIKSILEKDVPVIEFTNKNKIQDIFLLIQKCNLVISCSSDIMYLAGLTNVPQISIFGEENPFNIAPIGANKKFIKKSSNLISEITGDEVYKMVEIILNVEIKNEQ